jgi:predicted DNA-binding transcriptional regulator AlpA
MTQDVDTTPQPSDDPQKLRRCVRKTANGYEWRVVRGKPATTISRGDCVGVDLPPEVVVALNEPNVDCVEWPFAPRAKKIEAKKEPKLPHTGAGYDHKLPFDESERLITLEQTAFYCGVCRQSIANWARRGDFPVPLTVGSGRNLRWRLSEVREWVANRPRVADRRKPTE